MHIVCMYTILNSIFIGERENAKEINAIDLNNSNVY